MMRMLLGRFRRSLMLAGALAAVVAAGFSYYYFGYEPLQQELTRAEAEIRVLQGRVQLAKSLEARRQEMEDEKAAVQDSLERIASLLPRARSEPQFLVYLEEHARQLGVTVWWIDISEDVALDAYGMWPVRLMVLGAYPEQLELVRYLEAMPRLIAFTSVWYTEAPSEVRGAGDLLGTYDIRLFFDPHGLDWPWDPDVPVPGRDDPFALPGTEQPEAVPPGP